jgi:hypothetical protein
VQELLSAAGHESVAPDLPVDDPDAGWADYADVAMRSLEGHSGGVIAVGHSLAGGIVPLLAASRPISRLVFVCSFPPEPGKSLDEALAREPSLTEPAALVFRGSVDERGRYVWPSLEAASYAMYHDCPSEAARHAFDRLRPQATKPFSERWPLDTWPSVPTTFIVCSGDRMGSAEHLTAMARRRFGLEAVRLGGSHSPFLSRPDDLVRVLTMET